MGNLTKVCQDGSSLAVYRSLRAHMAEMLETVDSGRDYAAIVKSFIDVQEKIDELEPAAKPGRNALAQAQRGRLKVVNG